MEEKLIYDDAQHIKISKTTVYAGEKRFPLRSIRQIFFRRIPASKRWAALFFLIGIILILAGSLDIFVSLGEGLEITPGPVDSHSFIIGAGVLTMLAGVAIMVLSKDKFVVSIMTEKGEERIVRTHDREYAAKLTGILMKTLHRFIPDSAGKRLFDSMLM